MLLKTYFFQKHEGYIAGAGDGIVTVAAEQASRRVDILDAESYEFIASASSLGNGHYMITGLDKDKEYIVIARDYKRVYEPTVFDYVKPASDLTAVQQRALWKLWQK